MEHAKHLESKGETTAEAGSAVHIALLIPCYNAEETIERVLDAAVGQTIPFAEIVCYDDASIDATAAIVAKYPEVHLISGKKNQGPSVGRNQLAQFSSTPYIHFHDADDILYPNFVERITPHLAAESVVYCDMLPEGHSGKLLLPEKNEAPTAWIKTLHLNRSVIPRESFLAVGGFEEDLRIAEDTLLQFRLIAGGLTYVHVPELLAEREIRANSIVTSMTWGEQFHGNVLMLEHLESFAPERLRSMVGQRALDIAWDLYFRDCREDAERSMAVATACGEKIASDASPIHRSLAGVLGWKALFFLRRKWAILRGVNPKQRDQVRTLPNTEQSQGNGKRDAD